MFYIDDKVSRLTSSPPPSPSIFDSVTSPASLGRLRLPYSPIKSILPPLLRQKIAVWFISLLIQLINVIVALLLRSLAFPPSPLLTPPPCPPPPTKKVDQHRSFIISLCPNLISTFLKWARPGSSPPPPPSAALLEISKRWWWPLSISYSTSSQKRGRKWSGGGEGGVRVGHEIG